MFWQTSLPAIVLLAANCGSLAAAEPETPGQRDQRMA